MVYGTFIGHHFQKIIHSHLSVGLAVAAGFAIWRLIQHFRWGRCPGHYGLQGKTVIITGANSGVGKATALELVRRDARVILACRNVSSAEEAKRYIRKHTNRGEMIVRKLDLASFHSIHEFVREFKRGFFSLDVLINNAGIYRCPKSQTEDGYEMHFGVNYLGHFLLTKLLLEDLQSSAPSRVVVVTSAHYSKGSIDFENLGIPDAFDFNKYDGHKAYSNSKLAEMLFGVELSKRLAGTGVNVYMVSPGIVWTNLGRHIHIPWWKKILLAPLVFMLVKTPSEGCQGVVFCAASDQVYNKSGCYFRNCKEAPIDRKVVNDPLCCKLWDVSENLTRTISN